MPRAPLHSVKPSDFKRDRNWSFVPSAFDALPREETGDFLDMNTEVWFKIYKILIKMFMFNFLIVALHQRGSNRATASFLFFPF
jgi:hypothetical protein